MESNKITYNAYEGSDIGHKRSANEDSYGQMPLGDIGHLFIVCDGMGGHVGGAEASRTAVSCIKEYFATHELKKVPELSINEAIEFANTQIFYKSSVDSAFAGMGTTCVLVLLMNDGKAYYAHVGDSRIYLYSGGKLNRLTKDHSFVQTLVDIGQLKEVDMESHPRKNQITRALGIDERVEPDMPSNPARLAKGDMLLLCTDGLNGMVGDDALLKHLKSCAGTNPVPGLIELALKAGGKDNVTATVLQVTSSPEAKTYFEIPAKPTGTGVPTRTISDGPLTDSAGIGKFSSKKRLVLASLVLLVAISLAAFWRFGNNDVQFPEGKDNGTSTSDGNKYEIDSIKFKTGTTGSGNGVTSNSKKTDKKNNESEQTEPSKNNKTTPENNSPTNTPSHTIPDDSPPDEEQESAKPNVPNNPQPAPASHPNQAEIKKLQADNQKHRDSIANYEKYNKAFDNEKQKCQNNKCKNDLDLKIKKNEGYISNRNKDIKDNDKKIEALKNQQ